MRPAGAVAIEAWTTRAAIWRPALAAYALLAGILLVPLLMPVLPERTMTAYDRVAQSLVARVCSLRASTSSSSHSNSSMALEKKKRRQAVACPG